jgi:signal transduction histidine kinase
VQLYYTALLHTASILNRERDFNVSLQLILEHLLQLSQADFGAMLLMDEPGEFEFIGGRDGKGNELAEGAVWLSQALIQRCYTSADTLYIPDVVELRSELAGDGAELRGVVILPMLREESIFGMVFLGCGAPMRWLDHTDLSVLKAITAQLSLVTDQAVAMNEINRLNDAFNTEVARQTESLSQANEWLAETLKKTEHELADQWQINKTEAYFWATLIHELRLALRLMFAQVHTMKDSQPQTVVTPFDAMLRSLITLGQHGLQLMSRIDLLRGPNDERLNLKGEEVDLGAVVEEVIPSIRNLLRDKTVEIAAELPSDLPKVAADTILLRQVLLNLLENALLHTSQGSIKIGALEKQGQVIINVADTGQGMQPEKLKTLLVFDQPLETSPSGLQVSKDLVDSWGGRFWVTSTVGHGSTVYFSVPAVLSLDLTPQKKTNTLDESAPAFSGAPSKTGNFGRVAHGSVALYINGSPSPLILDLTQQATLGRYVPGVTPQPRVDLTPFGALDTGVSRLHAVIRRVGVDMLEIADLGSSNGTWLNGERLEPYLPSRLRPGDQLRLSQLPIKLHF